MDMRKRGLLFVMLMMASSVGAQMRLSLQSCLEQGLAQNYEVQIVRNEAQIAANDATAANAGMLPTLDLAAGYGGSLMSDRTKLSDGTTTKESASYDQAANVGVALNWTIFDGLRLRTNYKRLQELEAMGELQTRITIEDFIATLTAEYYNLVQQTLRLSNFRYAVELSRERMRITEARYLIGDFSRLDFLQARVDFNADSSKYMSQQELVRDSRIRIHELMANDGVETAIVVQDTLITVNADLVWNDLQSRMLANNPQLLMAERETTLSELDLRTAKARNYPAVTFSAGYGYTFNRYGAGATKHRGSLGPDVGLKIGFRLFDGNRRREQRNASIRIQNSRIGQQQLRQQLLADLATLWQSYQNNLELIQLEEQNLVAAKENYAIAMERYLLGDLPGIEMREAQKSLLDAEERILQAQYNTKLCEISLQQISSNVAVYLQ